ncbi:MAG: hypothetical protein WC806_00225 [Candidatus Gracilibacteria bacterium]|jgi:hypothetical protein
MSENIDLTLPEGVIYNKDGTAENNDTDAIFGFKKIEENVFGRGAPDCKTEPEVNFIFSKDIRATVILSKAKNFTAEDINSLGLLAQEMQKESEIVWSLPEIIQTTSTFRNRLASLNVEDFSKEIMEESGIFYQKLTKRYIEAYQNLINLIKKLISYGCKRINAPNARSHPFYGRGFNVSETNIERFTNKIEELKQKYNIEDL